jgi:TonB family protein
LYDKGNAVSRTLFYPDRKKQMSFGVEGNTIKGEVKIWSQAGQLSFLGNYKNNLKDGKCQTFNPDGSVDREGTYKEGKLISGVPAVEDLLYDKPDETAHFPGGYDALDAFFKEKSESFLSKKESVAKNVTVDSIVGTNGEIPNEKNSIATVDKPFHDHLKDGIQNSQNDQSDSAATKIISIKLTVEKNGHVSEKTILSKTSLLEKETINSAFLNLPPFVPATVEGVAVRSILYVSVIIRAKGLLVCTPGNVPHGQVFLIVEDMPEFPGGRDALQKFIGQCIRYPVSAQENGITGKVYVNFVVAEDGSIQNVQIARGVDPALDAEAIRVIKSLPKWIPGRQKGNPVAVSYTVPVNFQIQ